MGYLNTPRLCFRGAFWADAPTNNNLLAARDLVGKPGWGAPNWTWNPGGTGLFQLMQDRDVQGNSAMDPTDACRVQSAWDASGRFLSDPADDPVIQSVVLGVAATDLQGQLSYGTAKLADLDPEQRRVTDLVGLDLSVVLPATAADPGAITPRLIGRLRPTQIRDYRSCYPTAQTPKDPVTGYYVVPNSAVWQSVLDVTAWSGDLTRSPVLQAVRAASPDRLSVRLVATAYHVQSDDPRFGQGRLLGVIGPYRDGDPTQFLAGRRMIPVNGATAAFNLSSLVVNPARKTLVVNLGNAIPWLLETWSVAPSVPIFSVNPAILGPVGGDNTVGQSLGQPLVADSAWWLRTAGVAEWPLTPDQVVALADHRVGLLASDTAGTAPELVLAEHTTGQYADVDARSLRMDAGTSATLDVHAYRLGLPLPGLVLDFNLAQQSICDPILSLHLTCADPSIRINSTPGDVLVPGPGPLSVTTDAAGHAVLTLTAAPGPIDWPASRQSIDSQVYFLGDPSGWQSWGAPGPQEMGAGSALSVLVFNARPVPDRPAWDDVAPILQMYARLFPGMAQKLDIGDELTVATFAVGIAALLSKPADDPGRMPVTRDIAEWQRQMILTYLRYVNEGS